MSKFNQELKKIDRFLDTLGKTAAQDGKVTREERSILNAIMNELGDYRLLVMDCAEDGIIDKREEKQMKAHREKILSLANDRALRDGIISRDEEELIDTLFRFVES